MSCDCERPVQPKPRYEQCPCKLRDGVYEHARVVVSNGCIVDVAAGEPFVYVPEPCCGQGGGSSAANVITSNTNSVSMSGNGTANTPLKANVNVSPDAGNVLTAKSDGLYVAGTIPQSVAIAVGATNSVALYGNGSMETPVKGEVRVSNDQTNAIQAKTDGIYCAAAVPKVAQGNGQLTEVDENNRILTRLITRSNDSQSVIIEGSGTGTSPLRASFRISPDTTNSIELKDMPGGGRGLYVRQETTRLVPFAGSRGYGSIVWDLANGYCMAIGHGTFSMSAGGPPVVQATIPAVQTLDTYGHSHTIPSQTISMNNFNPCNFVLPTGELGFGVGITWEACQICMISGVHLVVTASQINSNNFFGYGFGVGGLPGTATMSFIAWGRRNDHE